MVRPPDLQVDTLYIPLCPSCVPFIITTTLWFFSKGRVPHGAPRLLRKQSEKIDATHVENTARNKGETG